MNQKNKKQISRFLVAGFSAVATDWLSYHFLIIILNKSLSKGISFILGTFVAYIINKYWTFEKKEKSVSEAGKFILLYLSTLLVNVGVNKLFIHLNAPINIAFLFATATSATLNFIGQKWWVFSDKSTKQT
jgi:putative flippase GtrA